MSRPEHLTAPQDYYVGETVKSYARNSRVQFIQRQMTLRAIEMLRLPPAERQKCLILDIGCGSCLSGEMIAYKGHDWVGVDISREMLLAAKEREFEELDDGEDEEGEDDSDDYDEDDEEDDEEDEEEEEEEEEDSRDERAFKGKMKQMGIDVDEEGQQGPKSIHEAVGLSVGRFKCDVVESDMGAGLPFRPGVFDGAISISAVQWLLVASSRDQVPERRIKKFFNALQSCLAPGARAVLQFYPENTDQINKLTLGATQCGFNGGVVVDYPHSTKARKYYLVLYSGHPGANYRPPRPLGTGEEDDEDYDAYYNNNNENQDGADGDNDGDADGGEFDNKGRRKVRVFNNVSGKDRHDFGANQSAMKRRRVDAGARPKQGSKNWVLMKKAERRNRGEKTFDDSKYTMRRRKPKF